MRNAADAAGIAESIRAAAAEREHPTSDSRAVRLTLSVGHATHVDGEVFGRVDDLIEAARTALGAAKSAGRNRCMAFATQDAENDMANGNREEAA
ncbi:MAG: diguanylate cyclase [Candidatus Eisenbacteria bacterium]|nr:diguanylate cyclase [Candidatus Eisenbacteria bacterium]